jgi:hypothetical protein
MIYKTLHRKLKIEPKEPNRRIGDEPMCSGRFAVSAPLVAVVVLFMLNSGDK